MSPVDPPLSRPGRPARPRPGSGSWWSRSAAVGTVVVVAVVASVSAVVAANRNDGAATPGAAVTTMLGYLAEGDLTGAIGELPPGEREAITADLGRVVGQLGRLGLVRTPSVADVLTLGGGAAGEGSVRVEGLTTSEEVVGQDVVLVRVTGGRLVGKAPETALAPEGRELVRLVTGLDVPAPGEAVDVDLAARHVRFVTLKEGGGWHVSLWESLAEAVRDRADPRPAWRDAPGANGAETPNAAVTDLFRAASDLDPGRAFALANPDESHALYAASPLFLASMRRDATRWVEDEGFGFPPPQVTVQVDGSGSERTVTVTGFAAIYRDREARIDVSYRNRCLTFEHRDPADEGTVPPTTLSHCDGDVTTPIDDSIAGRRFSQVTVWAGLGRAFPTFVVRERNGRWFISPTRTVLRTLAEILEGLQPGQVPAFLDRSREVATTLGR